MVEDTFNKDRNYTTGNDGDIEKTRGLGKTSRASSPHERTKTTWGQAGGESSYPGEQSQYKLLM